MLLAFAQLNNMGGTESGLSVPAPVITTMLPASCQQNDVVTVHFVGTDFVVGDTVVSMTDSSAFSAFVVYNHTLTTSFDCDFAPHLATLGAHTVTVTTSNGASNTKTFTVTAIPAAGVDGSFILKHRRRR